jgi:SPP1 family predicted phage head-tail adaptor
MADLNVSISDLNVRITFQQPTISKDAGGAQSASYANVAVNPTVWAKIVYDHGQELVQGDAAKAVERATITVRYRSDISSVRQVVLDGANWRIISPAENVQHLNRWSVFRIEKTKGTVQ